MHDSFMDYSPQDNGAIRYLEFCVQSLGIKDPAIHNYLLALYAKLQPEQLMKYLYLQGQVCTIHIQSPLL